MAEATILIVDDNPTNLAVLSDAIAPAGWETLIAVDGLSSIEQAQYAHPDLILLDVMMPNIDGFETCSRLKKNPKTKDIPVIFMTALTDAQEKIKGLSLGAVDYITKPFNKEEVLARVKVHLELRRLSQTLADQKATLEQQVQERTAQLEETISELKRSQLQLVQSEKLSTLGELVAGVAHEINNPLTFIDANIDYVEKYSQALIDHIHVYQTEVPEPPPRIGQHAEDVELDYTIDDLKHAIQSMRVGTERIINISRSLRTFSRSDDSQLTTFDVHEGLESTLLILKHRLTLKNHQEEIKVIRNFGTVPEIACYPGQLSQVLMNLLANAIDALEAKSQQAMDTPLEITITTEHFPTENEVEIRIADNGLGIPPEIQAKIFDYLFTTKAVGKGTGLGLSICQQIIVDKHQGHLTFESQANEGTTFIIRLPCSR